MKKILIFYAAYGGGHLSAARSIKEYIENNYKDVEIKLVDCVKYVNKSLDKLTTTAYNEMAKKAPWAWGRIYSKSQKGVLAHISNNSNKIMSLKLNNLLQEYNPDLIISTHPFGSQMCTVLKQKGKITAKIATIMTDYAPHDQWLVNYNLIDYFFVAHDGMKQDLIEKGIDKNKIYATGIPLSNRFLMSYNKKEILDELGLVENKRTVLFFAGGEFGLGKSKTYDMLRTLAKDFDNIQVVAISGRNPKMKRSFEYLVEQEHKEDSIKVLDYTTKIPELMSISDLVITKPGGLTTSESLASGLPIIVINPIPGQEEENASFLENKGVAIWIKKHDDASQILKDLFSSPEKMQKMKVNARLLAKKNSSKDICETLLKNEG
jgi:processive 1,2-diacylglycerol beta-glucosyltransferase